MCPSTALQFGVHYHIFNRGNNRENLFIEERNYRHFLALYAKYVHPVADTYAYCLLPNHFHLLVRIKTEEELLSQSHPVRVSQDREVLSPSRQFSHCFNAYAKAFNKAYMRTGSLLEKPFRRIPVTNSAYIAQLIVYIHHNPRKHGLVDDFLEWPYMSYHTLLSAKSTCLARNDVLAWFDGRATLRARHQQEPQEAQIAALLLEDLS